ncbi:MAG: STAS domain-containing protein [Anaerolineales bacterium]
MELSVESFKHCDLIKIKGRVDSQTSPQLAEAINERFEDGRYKIVMDMNDVEFISSAGLRVLINAQKTCRQFNRGEIILAGVPERIYETLDLAGLLPLFPVKEDVLHAVGSC